MKKILLIATGGTIASRYTEMSVYQVGQTIKDAFDLPESFDMTLESTVTKVMWILGSTRDPAEFKRLFYTEINHDILFN